MQLLPSLALTSFEWSMFELGYSNTVLCVVVYRPPKYNKDFVNDFADILADYMPKYDRVLIVGDFTIHLCCPHMPMAKAFLNLIDSFNFMQCANGPTHERGHTLDLVLSYGFPVFNIQICQPVFFDHSPVIFQFYCVLLLGVVIFLIPPLLNSF